MRRAEGDPTMARQDVEKVMRMMAMMKAMMAMMQMMTMVTRGGRCSIFLTMRCFNDAMFSDS